jgi:hypothetical protein
MQEGMVSSRAPIKGAFSSGFAVSYLVTIVEASKAEFLVPTELIPVFNSLSFKFGARPELVILRAGDTLFRDGGFFWLGVIVVVNDPSTRVHVFGMRGVAFFLDLFPGAFPIVGFDFLPLPRGDSTQSLISHGGILCLDRDVLLQTD